MGLHAELPGTAPSRYRLGIAVKILGATGLRSHDSRRWQNHPHLSVSLAYLHDIFTYLHSHQIRLYRLANQLAPYVTHPELPQFHAQLEECALELAAMGDLARLYGLRLSVHPAFQTQLNSLEPGLVSRAQGDVTAAAALLDAMGLGAEAVVVLHVGGAQGGVAAGRERFVRAVEQLPAPVRGRLALEHDDRRYSLTDTLWIHRRTGVRLIFDLLHHRCLNPDGLPLLQALGLALATWPGDQQPKIHLSSPRTEARYVARNGARRLSPPLPNQHSDFIHPFECIDLLREARQAGLRPFDIMLEAKAHDLALLRLREQIRHFAPELSGHMA